MTTLDDLSPESHYVLEMYELIAHTYAVVGGAIGGIVATATYYTGIYATVEAEHGIWVALFLFLVPTPILMLLGGIADGQIRTRYQDRIEEARSSLPRADQKALDYVRERTLNGWASSAVLLVPLAALTVAHSVLFPPIAALAGGVVSVAIALVLAPFGRHWVALGVLQLPIFMYDLLHLGSDQMTAALLASFALPLVGLVWTAIEQRSLLRRAMEDPALARLR